MRTITRFLRRFLILLIVFVMGVAGTAFLMNNETTDDRSDMNNPTLPEVMVDFNGTLANRMHGYRQPMEADFVRDSVTPLCTQISVRALTAQDLTDICVHRSRSVPVF